MFRLRSKSGDESVFRSPEEIRSALLSGFITPDAQIWDADLKGWVPLLEHPLYQQIAGTPGARKSGAVKGPPPSGPPAAKPIPKLVIKRPGEPGTTAIPGVKPPAPSAAPLRPAPPPPPAESHDLPDLELLEIDFTPEPVPPPPTLKLPVPAPRPPVAAPPVVPAPIAPRRPTPPPSTPTPAPVPVVAPRASTPRMSTPRMPATVEPPEERDEVAAGGGSKKGLIIGAVVVLLAAGGAFAVLGSGKGSAVPPVDSAMGAAPAAPIDTTLRDGTSLSDSTKSDSTSPVPVAAPVDTARPVVTVPALKPDTTPAAAGITPVAFAPSVARGPVPWNARPIAGAPLSIPALEVVRLRYLAAQSRALGQFEAGLEAAGFTDLFDPSRVSNASRRDESLDAVDAGRAALRDFRRRQAAIDFAYTDSMRQAMPPGSDTPDFRTFGPILRETPAQAALTDSIVGAVAEIYGMLVSETGGYALRGGMLIWKDADNAERYQVLQERLTSQLARVRTRNPADVPPGLAAVLRGVGLPR